MVHQGAQGFEEENAQKGEGKCLRNEYLKARAGYSKAVKSAKRSHLKRRREQLEQHLQCPKEVLEGTKENECGQREETRSKPALCL